MASISTETDPIIEGIMNFSLKPYAEVHNISLKELVFKLYEYHQGVLMEELDNISNIPNSESESTPIIINTKSREPKPKKRGRPPGSKNKSNKDENNEPTNRGPGRPRKN
jgi:hypothetical protein